MARRHLSVVPLLTRQARSEALAVARSMNLL